MTAHTCHAINCAAMVPHHIFMCARHWRMVPAPLKAALRETWANGGVTSAWRENANQAISVVAAAEGSRSAPGVTPGMKALTVWQPWASLIMIGGKPYEFRTWNFTDKPNLAKLVGQRIVIHAGARLPKKGELEDVIERINDGQSALVAAIAKPFVERALAGEQLTFGAALGTAVLGNPVHSVDLFGLDVADSDRGNFNWAWPVSDVQPFPEPIPSAGAQGFWNWS